MKIFSAVQIKQWDAFTIANEPVAAIDLMERAATACCEWLIQQNFSQKHFDIFCGKGNNGGDGLAIARILLQKNYAVTVYILEFGNIGTTDFQTNLAKLHEYTADIHYIQSGDFFPVLKNDAVLLDALFGTGLNKPLQGISALLVNHINTFIGPIIAIDLPSGLSADISSKENVVVNATHTLSFQNYKLAFLLPENEKHFGDIRLLNINLHKAFEDNAEVTFELVDKSLILSIYKQRDQFYHKGNFGYAAIVAGSYGMMGAAVLSSKACLRIGAGKVSCYVPRCGYTIMQTTVPEAMCVVSGEDFISAANGIEKFDAIGIGPGIGTQPTNVDLLKDIFTKTDKPLLLDADALNTISANKALFKSIPPNSVLTPHPKEFEKLFGQSTNDFDRLQTALQQSKALDIYIVLKGHYTFISTPQGKGYFNSTGNAGMATAGSGDVLSGIITGLLAQGYSSLHSAILGVYLHGLAGDFAAAKLSQEAMIASDITEHLGAAFKTLL